MKRDSSSPVASDSLVRDDAYQRAVKQSDSGQLSVPIEAVLQTETYKRRIALVRRIRTAVEASRGR